MRRKSDRMHRCGVLAGFGVGVGLGAFGRDLARSTDNLESWFPLSFSPMQVWSLQKHFELQFIIICTTVHNRITTCNRKLGSAQCIPKVSAASAALSPSPLSPAVSPPSIYLPEKPQISSIPPEPSPGFSRVSEIMRFGFPGLDNIRSCK